MCVNNLPRVALDSGEARIRTRDLLIASPVLTTRPPSHTLWSDWSKNKPQCNSVVGLLCDYTDSGHFTIRDIAYDKYSDDDDSNAATPMKQNRTLSSRYSTGQRQVTSLLVMFQLVIWRRNRFLGTGSKICYPVPQTGTRNRFTAS